MSGVSVHDTESPERVRAIMKLAVTADPESGMSLEKVTKFQRKMAKDFPTQIRICEVPPELYQQYRQVESEWRLVQAALSLIFKSSSQSEVERRG